MVDRAAAGGLLKPEILAGFGNLELLARAVVSGFLIGLHRSPRFGFSQEFAEYRAYNEGDDPRFVDWNVYARTGRTYVKRFLGDTNTHLTLLLDVSGSMGFASNDVSKLQYGKFLAASLAWLASHQHDGVGLILFDDGVRYYRPPSTRTGTLQSIIAQLENAGTGGGTNLHQPFEHLAAPLAHRGMVVAISDFYCDPEQMLESIRQLAMQGQDLLLFHLLDPQELNPQSSDRMTMQDLETGETVPVSDEYLREVYPQRIRDHIAALQQNAARLRADYWQIDTSQPLNAALRNYMLFRQRRS